MIHEIPLPRFKKRSLHAIPPEAVFHGASTLDGYEVKLLFSFPPVKVPLRRGREFSLSDRFEPHRGEPLCTLELRVLKSLPDLHTFYVYEIPVK